MTEEKAQEQKRSLYSWQQEAKRILRAELVLAGLNYRDLAEKLQDETERSVANKIFRGSFSFVFFLQVMRAINVGTISIAPRNVPQAGEPPSPP